VQAVVSGLGLLSMSREAQYTILADAFELMPEDGSFVQFTYGPVTPVADEVMRRLDLRARRHGFTLRNLPPASVYVFTRANGELQPGGREIARRRSALDAAQEGAGGTLDAHLQAAGLQLTQINQVHAPGRNIECVRKSETLR
jgi:hypothetical protein